MKVLNFYNVKGGTGKSSLSYLSGIYLASRGNRVLFIDLDPQCSLTSIFTNEPKTKTIYNFLADSYPLEEVIFPYSENIDFIPSSLNVFKIQNNVLQNKFERSFRKLKNYDYVIIDNSPNYSSLSISSIQGTDLLIIPSQVFRFDYDSLVFTLMQSREVKENLSINIILNRVGKAESREENLFSSSNYLQDCTITRFPNMNSIRKFILNRDSLQKPKNIKIREGIENFLNPILSRG